MNTSQHLDELTRVGEELRALFAAERTAISSLDHGKLEEIASSKIAIATRLEKLRAQVDIQDPVVRELFIAIRTEARATAILATAANQAVRSILGYQPANAYDRRARQQSTGAGRVLARF